MTTTTEKQRLDGRGGGAAPHPLDERRAQLRRGLRRAHRGDPAEHRGDRAGRPARPATHPGALAPHRLRVRAGAGRGHLHRVVAQGGPRRARALRARRRGLDPQRGDQVRGLLVRLRQQPDDRPAHDHVRVAGPAGAEGDRHRGRRHLCDLRRHPRDGRQPDGGHGGARLPRLVLDVQGRPTDRLRPRVPHPPGQPVGDPRLPALPGGRTGADDPPRRPAAAPVAVRRHRARGVRPRRLLRAGAVRHRVRHAGVPGQARLLGPGGEVQRPQARLDQRRRRLPERRRHLHRVHHARLPGQVHALHGRAARAARCQRQRARCTAP